MTPMEQLDIIKGCEAIEAIDDVEPSPRDLEVLLGDFQMSFRVVMANCMLLCQYTL